MEGAAGGDPPAPGGGSGGAGGDPGRIHYGVIDVANAQSQGTVSGAICSIVAPRSAAEAAFPSGFRVAGVVAGVQPGVLRHGPLRPRHPWIVLYYFPVWALKSDIAACFVRLVAHSRACACAAG